MKTKIRNHIITILLVLLFFAVVITDSKTVEIIAAIIGLLAVGAAIYLIVYSVVETMFEK